jgi:hypothetical protein
MHCLEALMSALDGCIQEQGDHAGRDRAEYYSNCQLHSV